MANGYLIMILIISMMMMNIIIIQIDVGPFWERFGWWHMLWTLLQSLVHWWQGRNGGTHQKMLLIIVIIVGIICIVIVITVFIDTGNVNLWWWGQWHDSFAFFFLGDFFGFNAMAHEAMQCKRKFNNQPVWPLLCKCKNNNSNDNNQPVCGMVPSRDANVREEEKNKKTKWCGAPQATQ